MRHIRNDNNDSVSLIIHCHYHLIFSNLVDFSARFFPNFPTPSLFLSLHRTLSISNSSFDGFNSNNNINISRQDKNNEEKW